MGSGFQQHLVNLIVDKQFDLWYLIVNFTTIRA